MRLLIVEDDAPLAEALRDALARRGIDADLAGGVADAAQMLAAAHFAAVLLDLGLPDGEGLALVRRLRAAGHPLPVIVVTARGDLDGKVDALNIGADDYLVKPFDVDELVARLHAVLRRQGLLTGARVQVGNAAFDTLSLDLVVDGRAVELSARERQLADLLFRRAGQVVRKQSAEDQLFGLDEPVGSNAVEVYAHRLRRKLGTAGATARIETVRGVGYLLRAAP